MEIEEAFEQDTQKIKAAVNPMTYIRGINSLNSALSTLKELRDRLFGNDGTVTAKATESVYSGQHTDIANIARYENGTMPANKLDDIEDKTIQNNAKEEFDIAEKDGYITHSSIDGQDCYTLTEKGREHINSQEFVKQFEIDQKNAMINSTEPKAVVNFSGNSDDLNIFRYAKNVNLNNESENVQKYFAKCQKEGFVEIKDGVATTTDKTSQWLKNTPDTLKAKGNIKLVTADNAEDVLLKKTSKQAIQTAEKHFASENTKAATKTATKETGKTVTKTAVKETSKATAKTVAKESGKAATKEAVKVSATTTGVASGAATAGVGTVITIAVEAAQLLAKQANNQKKEMTNVMSGK